MFIKITKSGSRRYVQLVEALRNEDGQPRQRTIATLGRLDRLDSGLESVINGLLRATGRAQMQESSDSAIRFESSKALGDVWALDCLWAELGFDRIGEAEILLAVTAFVELQSMIGGIVAPHGNAFALHVVHKGGGLFIQDDGEVEVGALHLWQHLRSHPHCLTKPA